MARIAGVNIPQNKIVQVGLTYIYGIGEKFSKEICSALKAVSLPDPGPLTSTDKVFIPYSRALEAAASAAICAA